MNKYKTLVLEGERGSGKTTALVYLVGSLVSSRTNISIGFFSANILQLKNIKDKVVTLFNTEDLAKVYNSSILLRNNSSIYFFSGNKDILPNFNFTGAAFDYGSTDLVGPVIAQSPSLEYIWITKEVEETNMKVQLTL